MLFAKPMWLFSLPFSLCSLSLSRSAPSVHTAISRETEWESTEKRSCCFVVRNSVILLCLRLYKCFAIAVRESNEASEWSKPQMSVGTKRSLRKFFAQMGLEIYYMDTLFNTCVLFTSTIPSPLRRTFVSPNDYEPLYRIQLLVSLALHAAIEFIFKFFSVYPLWMSISIVAL